MLVGAVTWAYAASFAGVSVFDDRPSIEENVSIRSWATVLHPPSTSTTSGRPVANLTFATNRALGHGPVGYHAVNLLIHLGAVLLVLGVVGRTLRSAALVGRFGRHATSVACAVALLRGVHPLTTGAVVYIVQRAESLMGLFYLLTLYCAIRAGTPGSSRLWIALAGVASALGMGSKEMMVTAPVMVWLWHVTFAGAPWAPWKDRDRRWLYLILCSTWLVLAILRASETQARTALRGASEAAAAGAGWTPWVYLWTQAGVIVHDLRLAIVPSPLVFDYYGWPRAASPLDVMPQVLLIAGLIATTIAALARRNGFGYAGAWLLGILAPTSSLLPIPTEIAAEHRMYLPLLAVVALIVVGAYAMAGLLRPTARRGRAFAFAAVVLALAAVLASQTRARARAYASEGGLSQDTVGKRPDNARARVNYGISLIAEGRHAEAAEGTSFVEQALQLDPGLDDADPVLGQVFSEVGDMARSLYYLRRAAAKDPQNIAVLTRLAWLLATTKPEFRDGAAALGYARQAVALTGQRDPAALEAIAAAFAEQRQFPEAAAALHDAAAAAERRGESAAAASLRRQADVYRRADERDHPARGRTDPGAR